jgi:hypothetical protein
MLTTWIYALIDPRDSAVRYVGKADSPVSRLVSHTCDKSSTRKARWLRSLSRQGLAARLLLLECAPVDSWQSCEREWIAWYRASGADLTNLTDGGEGLVGASPETRAKISANQKAAMNDPIHRAKVFTSARSVRISAALSGRPKSPAHVAKLPQNQPGRTLTAEHRAAISAGLRVAGWRHTPETKAKLRAFNVGNRRGFGNKSRTGQHRSAEERAKVSAALSGKPFTESHRKAIKKGALARWARTREAATCQTL